MKSKTTDSQARAGFEEEDLLRLELKIAKRADRLWRRAGRRSGTDLVLWLEAESEILSDYFAFSWRKANLVRSES